MLETLQFFPISSFFSLYPHPFPLLVAPRKFGSSMSNFISNGRKRERNPGYSNPSLIVELRNVVFNTVNQTSDKEKERGDFTRVVSNVHISAIHVYIYTNRRPLKDITSLVHLIIKADKSIVPWYGIQHHVVSALRNP